MKKLTISLLLLFSLLWAESLEKKAEQTILKKTNTQVKVLELKDMGIKKLSIGVLEISGKQVPILVSNDGETILGVPEIFLSNNEEVLNTAKKTIADIENYNSRGKQQRLLESFKDRKDNEVFLTSTGKKTNQTTYIVTDPNCPYCRDEMGRIDSVLQTSNVVLILVGIIGHEDSEIKSANILEAKDRILKEKLPKKEQEAKILSMIKEVYFGNQKPNLNLTQNSYIYRNLAKENSKLVIESGVDAVPYKFSISK
ncbi:hypothetical protein BKH46_08435 [Helicobacter sp. 12S02634-8]|uniref:hypothetical protein n=1 Tax=Helicobacter sp. 12S02634-8 TaxID=1476199 RepID=UPI000BA72483|nr:hypothetical protein [Helicobacter sp. 12S02634-8]PAF46257.1 hypothetical protein BKH46_08435 [Helicobacter sp. 12S02634-8]